MCGMTCTVLPVLAATLFLEHGVVNLAGREVVALGHLGAGEALIVPRSKVGLSAVLGDENLSRAGKDSSCRVDVDVGSSLGG